MTQDMALTTKLETTNYLQKEHKLMNTYDQELGCITYIEIRLQLGQIVQRYSNHN